MLNRTARRGSGATRQTCMHALIEQVSQSNQPLRLAANGESVMPKTIRTIFTARSRFALLALGAISLCAAMALPAMAGDDAPDAGAKNPSACRDVVNNKCLRKPNDGKPSQNQDTRNQDNAAAARAESARQAGVTAEIAKAEAGYQANKD